MSKPSSTPSKMRRFILFGGTPQLLATARHAKAIGADVLVVSEPFHLDERVGETGTLRSDLEASRVRYESHDKLTVAALHDHVDEVTAGISIYPVWIFRKDVIELFEGRLYNFHGAKLPVDRGGGAYSWRILMGIREGGLVIHRLEPGIDTGDIVASDDFVFPDECRIPADFLAFDAPRRDELLRDFVTKLANGDALERRSQDEASSTYWPRLNTKLNGLIDWQWSAKELERFICAFDAPYPGASTLLREQRVHVRGCTLEDAEAEFHPFQAGLVFRIFDGRLFVAARGGQLVLTDVTDENGDPLSSRIRPGDRFYTPTTVLDEARSARAVYGAHGLRRR